MQLFSSDATIFLKKKNVIKDIKCPQKQHTLRPDPKFSVLPACPKPAPNQPKSHIQFHENGSPRDFYIMTLALYSQLDSSQGVCPRAISNEFLSPSLSVRPTIMKSSHLALDTRQTHAFKHDHRHCCCAMLCHSYVTTTTVNHQVTYLMYEAPQRIVLTTFQLLTDMMDNLHRISNYTAASSFLLHACVSVQMCSY